MNCRNTKPATDICTRNTEGSVWTKPAVSADTTFLPPVHEPHPDEKTEGVADRVLRVTSECYVTLLHTLHSQKQTHTKQQTTETATATGTAAVWLYLIAVVLSPFVRWFR